MKKIRQWLKNKIIDIIELEHIMSSFNESLNAHDIKQKQWIYNLDNKYEYRYSKMKDYTKNFSDKADQLYRTVESVVDVAMDIHEPPRENLNFAVICVRGKMDYVYMTPMPARDMHEIIRFLKRWECSNKYIDAGPCAKEMIFKMVRDATR